MDRRDELIECLEGEIAKRDARIVELESKYQRDVYGLNNEGDPIGGDPAGGYANDNARLRAELSAIKAQGVVMPERSNERNFTDLLTNYAVGWNDCLDEVARLNAAPVQQVSVPDGWKLVPVEPTHEMLGAALMTQVESLDAIAGIRTDYKAMLAAVPAAPAADAWIPVSERLPDIAQEVIVHTEFDGVCAGVLDSYGEWFAPFSEYKLIRVTSWMPMPTKNGAISHD